MKNLTYKLLAIVFFFANSLHVVAGDTIKFVVRYTPSISIIATLDKQFTMRSVSPSIVRTFTGTGERQSLSFPELPTGSEIIIEGEEGCAITLISPSSGVSSMDFSRCPSIELISVDGIDSINLSNCVNLQYLLTYSQTPGFRGNLKKLDLGDCRALKRVDCPELKLSVLDINLSNNPAIEGIVCHENYLTLSNLYALSELLEYPYHKYFGRQLLGSRRVLIGDTLDYSSQKEFGGATTNFWILNGMRPHGYGSAPLADPSEYTIDNGVITFHKAGWYTVDMDNPNIIQNPGWGRVFVLKYIQTIDFVPVTEITNIPASVPVGIQYIFGRRIVLPDNATYTQVTWEVTDAGTTGAIIVGTSLRTTAPGTVKVRGTIKEGLAFDVDYTQDFVIEVTPLSIDEAAQGLEAIEVYPNPTTGELFVGIAGQARNDV